MNLKVITNNYTLNFVGSVKNLNLSRNWVTIDAFGGLNTHLKFITGGCLINSCISEQ